MEDFSKKDPLGCGLSVYLSKKRFFDEKDEVSFIQIGSCDLSHYDDFKHFYLNLFPNYNYKGLFIEPQDWAYENLLEKIENRDNFYCLNRAVGLDEGKKDFLQLKNKYIGRDVNFHWQWEEGMASLEGSEKKFNDDYLHPDQEDLENNDRFERVEVDVITLSQTFDYFFENVDCNSLDILFLDIEGMDFDLLYNNSNIINIVSPDVIFFESMHISQEESNKLRNCFYENYNFIGGFIGGCGNVCFLKSEYGDYKNINSTF